MFSLRFIKQKDYKIFGDRMPTVSLGPTKDTYVDQSNPNGNYGTSARLWIASWLYMNTYSRNQRSLLGFDLSQIAGQRIISATLRMYVGTKNYYPRTWILKRIAGTWTETAVTWANQPNTTDVNQVSREVDAYSPKSETFDLTLLAQDALNQGALDFGIMIQDASENYPSELARSAFFDSKEGATPAVLTITYEEAPPPTQYNVSVNARDTQAVSLGVPLTVDGVLVGSTPITKTLTAGNHTFAVDSQVEVT